jgi:hypothetical protein
MFRLVNGLLRNASSCQGEEGWFDHSLELGMIEDDSGHVISIGSHCRSDSTGGQEERGNATRMLQADEVGEERLEGDDPVHAAQMAALRDVGVDRKGAGEVTVDPNFR